MACLVEGCTSHSRRKENCEEILTFHRFPKDKAKEKWLQQIGKSNWTLKDHHRICSKHFASNSFKEKNDRKKGRHLKKNVLPTLYLSDKSILLTSMDDELNSSELGTQTYWQEAYQKELLNFDHHGDTGDVWFGEDSALRVVNWILKCGIEKNTPIIDLGCGNGYTLSELAREGFTNLIGVDYCAEAITLAKKVANSEFPLIKFQVFDIINDDIDKIGYKFGLVHDKGTYDAISLNPDNPKQNRLKYKEKVMEMLNENGFFVITSCNWTEAELITHFGDRLALETVIPTPQFKFGGKVGSVVSSVVFVKKSIS